MVDEKLPESGSGDANEPDDGVGEGSVPGISEEVKRTALADVSPVRLALIFALATLTVVTALCGWLGYSVAQDKKTASLRQEFVQSARQGAINLTSIDFGHADADVKRILDMSTGQFLDEFSARSAPFIEVVKKVQSKSVGTVTAAGIESVNGQEGEVLLAVSVATTTKGVPEERPRYWRMRMTVAKQGEDTKISKVEFVP